jgi:hypothetical protein
MVSYMFDILDSSPASRKLFKKPGPSPVLPMLMKPPSRQGIENGSIDWVPGRVYTNVREIRSGSWFRACSMYSIQVLVAKNCARNRVRVQFYKMSMKPALGHGTENSSIDWVPVRVHKMFEKFGPDPGFVHVR